MVDNKQQWKAWLYLSPAIILLLVFTVWPIINTLRMAFLEGYSAQAEAGGAVFAFGIGNFLKVIEYKKKAIECAPYSHNEYLDYFLVKYLFSLLILIYQSDSLQ